MKRKLERKKRQKKSDHWISVQEIFAQKIPFSINSDTIGIVMNIMQLIDAMINKKKW